MVTWKSIGVCVLCASSVSPGARAQATPYQAQEQLLVPVKEGSSLANALSSSQIELINTLFVMVRSHHYRCDEVSAVGKTSDGFKLVCDNYTVSYDVNILGATETVTVMP